MRKHFLILMLLTLLPLAGWAANYDVLVTPGTFYKQYGQLDPNANNSWKATTDMFTVNINPVPDGVKAGIANLLKWTRSEDGQDVGDHNFTLSFQDPTQKVYTDGDTYTITIAANSTGVMNIYPLDLAGLTQNDNIFLTLLTPQVGGGDQLTPKKVTDFTVSVALPIFTERVTLATSDYSVKSYGEPNNVVGDNSGIVTIKGTSDNFTGEKNLTFKISQGNIADATLTPSSIDAVEYTGDPHDLTTMGVDLVVSLGGVNLGLGSDYTISYDNNINVSTDQNKAKIIITGAGDYAGTKELEFVINPKSIVGGTLAYANNLDYTGLKVKPELTLEVGGTPLTLTNDYTIEEIEGQDYINAGSGKKVKVVGTGNYIDEIEYTYAIGARSISNSNNRTITYTPTNKQYEYTGSPITPTVVITNKLDGNNTQLEEGRDYTVEYKKDGEGNETRTNVGDDAQVRFVGKGNWKNLTSWGVFTITQKPLNIQAKTQTITVHSDIDKTVVYDGLVEGQNLGDVTYKLTAINDINDAEVAEADIVAGGTYYLWATVAATAVSANYDITYTAGEITVVAGQITVKTKDVNNHVYGTNPVPVVECTSGLSPAETEAFAPTNVDPATIIYTVKDYQNETVFTGTAAELADAATPLLPVGQYTVSVEGVEYHDYVALPTTGTWNIIRKDIDTEDITATPAQYKGAAIEELTFTTSALLGDSYEVKAGSWKNNVNVGEKTIAQVEAMPDGNPSGTTTQRQQYAAKQAAIAALPQVILTGTGNFNGETTVYFDITKAPLTITADAKVWVYGTAEPTAEYTATVGETDGEGNPINCLLGQDEEKDLTVAQEGFTGTLKVKRICSDNRGEYSEGLEPYGITNARNYAITYKKGKLSITKGSIVLKVKDTEKYYGTNETTAVEGLELELSTDGDDNKDLTDEVKANWQSLVDQTAVVYTVDSHDFETGETYTLSTTGEATSVNYDVTLKDGILTIVKRPVTFTVNALADVDYTDVPDFKADLEDEANIGTYVDVTGEGLVAPDETKDLVRIELNENLEIGENNVFLYTKDGADTNYEITLVHGKVKITNTGVESITLKRVGKDDAADPAVNTAAQLIEDHDGEIVNVSMTFPGQKMYAEKWYSMVLPFDTDVATVSKKFGYAIVDVFNENYNDAKDVSFKLHMQSLPANKPFILKVYKELSALEIATIVFENVTIKNSAAPEVSDAYGNKFVGTYTGYTTTDNTREYVFGLGQDATDYQPAKGSGTFIRPLGAYISFKDPQSETLAHSILIEEPDGSTTAIQMVSADAVKGEGWYTVNGIKLQSAPTEKGVYINNGKKVVIK